MVYLTSSLWYASEAETIIIHTMGVDHRIDEQSCTKAKQLYCK